MNRRSVLLALPAAVLAACARREEPTKTYAMRGEVKSVDAGTKSATIKHEKIGDWMEAMTMEFPVKPESEFVKLRPGAQIEATVVVGESSYYITKIKVK